MSVLVIPEFENDDEQLLEPGEATVAAAVEPVSDERANVPVTETAERFLRAVLAKVPLDRIEELHLFSPLRQGTAETGIAVIAARVIVPDEPENDALEMQREAGPDVEVDDEGTSDEVQADAHTSDEVIVDALVADDVNGEAEPDGEQLVEAAAARADEESDSDIDSETAPLVDGTDSAAAVASISAETPDDSVEDTDGAVAVSERSSDDDSPYADDPLPVAAEDMLDLAHELAPDVADEVEIAPRAPRVRHTVYTARYRLVIKGPDRGKWEMDVVDEADAPLLAVETVVRGVQRRAGEETATVRYDAQQLARALRINPAALP